MKEPVNQHKQMAEGDGLYPEQNFGVEPLRAGSKPNDEPDVGRKKHLGERERAAPKVNGYHPQPDHGPFE